MTRPAADVAAFNPTGASGHSAVPIAAGPIAITPVTSPTPTAITRNPPTAAALPRRASPAASTSTKDAPASCTTAAHSVPRRPRHNSDNLQRPLPSGVARPNCNASFPIIARLAPAESKSPSASLNVSPGCTSCTSTTLTRSTSDAVPGGSDVTVCPIKAGKPVIPASEKVAPPSMLVISAARRHPPELPLATTAIKGAISGTSVN